MKLSQAKIEELKKVTDRFIVILHDLYGLYLDSIKGFELYLQELYKYAQREVPGVIWAEGNPADPKAVINHSASISDLIERNKKEGSNVVKMRGFIVVMIFEHWECDIRHKIADVLGMSEKNEVKSDIMGEVAKIRHDILHNRGRIKNSASNKIIKFDKNNRLEVSEEKFKQIFSEIIRYLNDLSFDYTGSVFYLDDSLIPQLKAWHRFFKHIIHEV